MNAHVLQDATQGDKRLARHFSLPCGCQKSSRQGMLLAAFDSLLIFLGFF